MQSPPRREPELPIWERLGWDRLNPDRGLPIEPEDIALFEARSGLRLDPGHRAWLLRFGDGGGGVPSVAVSFLPLLTPKPGIETTVLTQTERHRESGRLPPEAGIVIGLVGAVSILSVPGPGGGPTPMIGFSTENAVPPIAYLRLAPSFDEFMDTTVRLAATMWTNIGGSAGLAMGEWARAVAAPYSAWADIDAITYAATVGVRGNPSARVPWEEAASWARRVRR